MNAPTPLQALILWAVIAKGGTASQKALRPALLAKDRKSLIALRLLAERKLGRAVQVEVTEAGWAWAAANTGAGLPPRANGNAVLADLLARIGAYGAAQGVPLAEIIRPLPAGGDNAVAAAAGGPAPDLEQRIRAAYFAVTHGALARSVRLAEIRAHLPDVPPAELDATLTDMASRKGASLMPIDDPSEITREDAAAVLRIGSFTRHLLWLNA